MKCITLTQPWATLVAIGAKRIETRSWDTAYRGPLAIHAAKGLGPVGGQKGLGELCSTEPFCSVLNAWAKQYSQDYTDLASMVNRPLMPFGAIVATCRLIQVEPIYDFVAGYEIETNRATYSWDITDQERAFGDYTPGRYAWLLADIEMLPEPIPAKDALGLWEWTL